MYSQAKLFCPEYIVYDLGKIWKILTCGHPINADKFGKVCDDFKTKFMNDDRVNFYEFNPTIHKGSIHIFIAQNVIKKEKN